MSTTGRALEEQEKERRKKEEERANKRANEVAIAVAIARTKSQNLSSIVPYIEGMDDSKPREFKTGRSSSLFFSKNNKIAPLKSPMGGRKSKHGRKKRANKRTMKKHRK